MRGVRRRVSRSLRLLILALSGRWARIPMGIVTNEYGFSMASDGWNYFRALVAEWELNEDAELENTTFFRFFQHPDIRSIRYLDDLLFLHDEEKREPLDGFKFYLGTFPWGHWDREASRRGGKPFGHHYDRLEGQMTRDIWGYRRNPWYQPGDKYPLEIEWDQIRHLYDSLRGNYRPLLHGSYPEVTMLSRTNGERRAVRFNGQHRLSIMSHLGQENVVVLVPPESLGVIREDEVEQWYYVRNGQCSPERALEIFEAFFILDGRERIAHLELNPVY